MNWVSPYLHALGWCTLIGCAWKASSKFSEFVDNIKDTLSNSKDAKDTINLVASNHIPHLQIELEKLNRSMDSFRQDFLAELKGMRQDLVNFLLASRTK